MSDNKRKCMVICLLALFIGLIGIVLPEQDAIAFEYIVNNTDLYNNGRLQDVTYTANDSAIQLFLIFHALGTGAPIVIDTNLSINGTVVQDRDFRTSAAAGIHEHFSMTAHIPKGANYSVTNSSNMETMEWREYPIITGRNGTLSINMTGGTGSQNLSQVLIQDNSAGTNNINMNENYIYNVSSIYEDHGNNQTYTTWDASTPVIRSRVSMSPYINFIEMYPNYTYFSKGMTIAGDVTMSNSSTNYTNTGKWLNIGYNAVPGLMEINTSSIFYYKQGANYLGFTGNGFAYSAYDDRPMKFGQSGTNYSNIRYNTTYGTTWQGAGTASKNLNITGFDKVNMYQELDLNNHALTNCSNCGGNQNLSQVLTQGNDAGAQNITNVKNINHSIINGSFGGFSMLGVAGTPFTTYFENNTMRSELSLGGSQIWKLRNFTAFEVGYIMYATPNDFPGFILFNSSLSRRVNMMTRSNGFMINAAETGSFKSAGLLVGTDDNITVSGLAGTGNAYACLDANGKLYRGNPTC